MIRICGETVSSRLSRRLHVETISTPSFEKSSLFSKWMERTWKRIEKIIFHSSPKSISPCVLIPSFPKEMCADILDRVSATQKNYEKITLFIGAVFSLFVSIFYQSSAEPAAKLKACAYIRDERRERCVSLLSSLVFLGLFQEVAQYLQNRIFVMEKSYV